MTRQKRKIEPTASESLTREDVPPCKYFLSTGSTLLDLAISDRHPGGVGSGRVTQIIGDNSTAKSVLVKEILGAAQRLGGYAVECEAEMTPDFQRSKLFGLDVGDWATPELQNTGPDMDMLAAVEANPASRYTYRNPRTVEEIFDEDIGGALDLIGGRWGPKRKRAEKIPCPVCLAVDTFTALPSEAELNRTMSEGTYAMEKAKSMSTGFRKYIQDIGDQNIALIAADHIRAKTDAGSFGRKWTTHGGIAMQQYASTRVFLSHVGTLKNKYEEVTGVKIKFRIVKNKIAPPFREGFFYVVFDYGIDDVRSNLMWLKEEPQSKVAGNPINVKSKTWLCRKDTISNEGINGAIRYIEDNNREEDLQEIVVKVWREMHPPSDRKQRKR